MADFGDFLELKRRDGRRLRCPENPVDNHVQSLAASAVSRAAMGAFQRAGWVLVAPFSVVD